MKLHESGQTEEALSTAATILRNARQAADDGPEHRRELVNALELLAKLQSESGDYEKAESLYIEAIDTAERCEVSRAQMARLRSGLATLYDFNQHEERAIPLYERAIEDYEQMVPPQEELSAQLRNNLAMIYKSLRRYSLAEQHYLMSLEILEKLHGRNDERVAAVYNNIGSLYYSAGHPAQAREMHEDALEIRRAVFGPDHPEVAQSHSNLATACYELQDDAGTQENYEKSLRILEAHLDTSSASYEQTANDYIAVLESIDEQRKADALKKRVAKLLKRD